MYEVKQKQKQKHQTALQGCFTSLPVSYDGPQPIYVEFSAGQAQFGRDALIILEIEVGQVRWNQ